MKSATIANAALTYAAKGLPVFPCNIDKKPMTKNGFYDATTDQAAIESWWRENPFASIGVPTGQDFFVLDVDLPKGPETLKLLEKHHGSLPTTKKQRTGSGGLHYFFRIPEGVEIRNSAGKIGPGLDVRGSGGYVIIPPSGRPSGGKYKFVNKFSIAEPPAWLVSLINDSESKSCQVAEIPNYGGSRYGKAALEDELTILANTGVGNRNHALNRAAFALGQLVAGGELDQGEVDSSLINVACQIGLTEREARRTIESGIASGSKEPRTALRDLAGQVLFGEKPQVEGYTTLPDAKNYRLTELGNAERFAAEHGELVRYVPAWRKWIFYDGKRWKVGADEQIRKKAHQTVKGLYALAAQESDNDVAAKLAKWAATSCRSASITAMLKESAPLMAIDPGMLDADPYLFNCGNCTINFTTGKLQAHRREDFLTRISQINFDPEAKAPTFERVLHTSFAGNQNLIGFVQRYAGYSMTGSQKEQCMAIWCGPGANGKSTILNPIAEALGEYAQTTRPEALMVRRGEGIPSDIAKLKGARLVSAAEAEDGHRLAESAIKQMTGGEMIQARALYQDWFEFVPQFKIILCTNHKPIIREDDHAIWRRIRLVPFDVTIPEVKQDRDLADKLRKELPGIFDLDRGRRGYVATRRPRIPRGN